MIQRRKQQATTAAAGEAERPQSLGIDSILSSKHTQGDQVIGQHRAGERLAERTGGFGQGVLMQPGRQIKPFVITGLCALLPP